MRPNRIIDRHLAQGGSVNGVRVHIRSSRKPVNDNFDAPTLEPVA